MNEFIQTVQQTLKTLGLYEINGILLIAYVMWEQIAALVVAGAAVELVRKAPESQRMWVLVVLCFVILGAFLAPAPVPILLAGMTIAGLIAVSIDRFNPDMLRWRAVGALGIYSLAALAYLFYGRYLESVDATAWAEAIGGQEAAQNTLAQGRSFLNTLATWGLWLILPMGYLSLLVQGILAHPPMGARPADTITAVRTRSG